MSKLQWCFSFLCTTPRSRGPPNPRSLAPVWRATSPRRPGSTYMLCKRPLKPEITSPKKSVLLPMCLAILTICWAFVLGGSIASTVQKEPAKKQLCAHAPTHWDSMQRFDSVREENKSLQSLKAKGISQTWTTSNTILRRINTDVQNLGGPRKSTRCGSKASSSGGAHSCPSSTFITSICLAWPGFNMFNRLSNTSLSRTFPPLKPFLHCSPSFWLNHYVCHFFLAETTTDPGKS